MNKNFTDFNALLAFIQDKGRGGIPITYRLLPKYAGMALYIGIAFDFKKANYELNLEWISFGLDFYGDTLQEGYLYKFETLEQLIPYLHTTYQIAITDIPIKFEFDTSLFPNPIKDADQKPIFEVAWQQFQKDFKNGLFLDRSLSLVHSTYP
jgi:hypothetical protein